MDPGSEFERDEIDDIREFTNEGGHLLMVGEPSRKRISGGFFGLSVSNQESALTTLAARYDMSLGTSYLYNLETNGGNYKHVVARPTSASGLEFEDVTMYTAASVSSRTGTVLLRTTRNTHEAGLDGTRRHPVAIHRPQQNVILLGDSSFLRADRFNVGDNEQFVAFLVEFLVSGERVPESDGGGDETDDGDAETPDEDGTGDGDGTDDGEGNGDGDGDVVNNTTTPGPETPAADLLTPVRAGSTNVATVAFGATSPTLIARPGDPIGLLG
jgi:hypothetical protein